ncbi:MAG: hypothetical protein CMK89_09665 [Pseudomonadales bacterium]|nr:hypothetical protein [Pseudomonadales bacterium]
MEHVLFAYGTLQLPEVMERLLGRTVQGTPAVLEDFRSGLVARANFPGIVPQVGETVIGTRLTGFTQDDLRALDRYEGELYRRIRVSVRLEGSPPHLIKPSWVYCMAPWAHARVTSTPWTIDWYRQFGRKGRLTYRY